MSKIHESDVTMFALNIVTLCSNGSVSRRFKAVTLQDGSIPLVLRELRGSAVVGIECRHSGHKAVPHASRRQEAAGRRIKQNERMKIEKAVLGAKEMRGISNPNFPSQAIHSEMQAISRQVFWRSSG
jgi:hypothetical protein